MTPIWLKPFRHTQEIWKNGKLYLKRYYLLPGTKKLKVHQILESDKDRHLHNHPWDFTTILLSGGYDEERMNNANGDIYTERHTAPCVLHRTANDYHRLTLIDGKPVVSLVFTSKKYQNWGFWTEDGHVDHEEYLGVGKVLDFPRVLRA